MARVLRPAWHALNRRFDLSTYWIQRRHFEYYKEVARLARVHVPTGGSVLDVGAANTDLLRWLDWFGRRVALDRRPAPPRQGIERMVADFMEYQPPSRFDLVLCLQVLEHLEDPAAFARRLMAAGRLVIISVPHRWPAGLNRGHLQDPVDEAMLVDWVGRPPLETRIVRNGRDRLVAVFRGIFPE